MNFDELCKAPIASLEIVAIILQLSVIMVLFYNKTGTSANNLLLTI